MTLDATHPSDDELMLALSGDRSPEADDAVTRHVAGCDRCQAVQTEIAAVLALVTDAPVPDPGDDFETRMWARIQPALVPEHARSWQTRHVMPLLAWAAAIGGIVVGGYLAAPRIAPRPEPAANNAAAPSTRDASDTRERVLLAAVDAHLARTEMLFVELLNTPAPGGDTIAFARATAGDLVSSGRLYRETALEAGDTPVSLVLDDLETVLVEVARTPDAADSTDLAALRGRIETADLLFKVRAVTHDIRARQDLPAPGEGAL